MATAPKTPVPESLSERPAPSGDGLRWILIGAGIVLILVATNLLRPPPSATAGDLPGAIQNAMKRRSGEPDRAEPRLIGELIGREYRVRCYAGTPSPTYTVLSLEGSLLAEGLSLSELPQRFPNLDPANMTLAPLWSGGAKDVNSSYQLMHAEEARTPER
jgi:hypothetical protein